MTTVEFRQRRDSAPEIRIYVGRSDKPGELRVLRRQRDLLHRLARRGEYDVLTAISGRVLTVEHVERLVDQRGIEDYRNGLSLEPEPDAASLGDHIERYLDTVETASSRRTYRNGLSHLRDHVADGSRLGDRAWHRVQPHNIKDLRDALLRRLERATVATYLGSWSAFFDWAISREESEAAGEGRTPIIEVNPVRKAAAWVRVRPSRHRFLSRAEYTHLIAVAAPAMRAQYATLTFCGLRAAEFRHLPPAHVDPAEKIHVGPWGNWSPKGYPRSSRGVRDVPVHQDHLRPLLEEYRDEWAGSESFFVNVRTGTPWSESAFRDQFARDVTAAGLVAGSRRGGKAQPEGVTPHTLRHTFASWLAAADVQLIKIAVLLGDTETTTRDIYAHLLPSDLDRSVQRLWTEVGG